MNLAPDRGTGKTENEYEYLSETSPKDKPWDRHRSEADGVGEHLTSPGTERAIWKQGKRMEVCAPALKFGITAAETGEVKLKLACAHFCRVRYCPVCQWRRSLMWAARFYGSSDKIKEQAPAGRWLYLTLTHKNCAIGDLRDELTTMNKAWHRLVKRKEFEDVLGWIKTVEITPGENGPGQAHPHFHVLMLVKSTYFKPGHYIAQPQWAKAWQEAMRLDYLPQVNVKAIRAKKGEVDALGKDAALRAAVAETLKYSVKPSDMLKDRGWFLELVRQTRRTRAVAAGGLLKDCLRVKDETQQDLLLGDEEKAPEPEVPTLTFNYDKPVQKYRRKRSGP